MQSPDSITALIKRLQHAGKATGFSVESFGQIDEWPLLGMTRMPSEPGPQTRHIYLSAGIHGDEPAPPQALLELLQSDDLPPSNHYYICPLLNPAGLAAGTRENAEGLDLNRDYRDFVSQEISSHAHWIETHVPKLDCAIHLHEDWESQGFYLYEINSQNRASRTQSILAATVKHLPIETANEIDGYPAQAGIIRPEANHQLKKGQAEALYLQEKFKGINYTLETPSSQDFRKRVDALKAGVLAALSAP